MGNIYALLAIFLFLSGCDLLTTWLDLFKLPKELRGQEANPVFGDMSRQWAHNVTWKVVASLLIALAAWKRNDIFPMTIIDICLFLVVVNNLSIFVVRSYLKRKTQTLGGLFSHICQRLHLPKQIAYFMTVFTLGALSWGLALLIK